MDDIRMAVQACLLGDSLVSGFGSNRFVEVFEREGQRVKEAVVRFGDPLADRVVRQMAVIADRDVSVCGILPRVKMALHNVAIDTRLRVIAEVARPLAVAEGKGSQAT